MLWFLLSFLTALAVTSHDVWVKRFFADLSTYEMLAYPLIYSLPLLVVFRVSGKIKWHTFADRRQKGIVAGLLFFAHILLHAFAISLTKAAYMISIKRLSVIIGLIYGGVIFKEKNLAVRTIGTLLMVSGAAIITLLGG